MRVVWSIAVLAVLINCAISSAENVPVLMHYSNNEQTENVIIVGHSLNPDGFKQLLSPIKSSMKVISVDKLSVQDLRDYLPSFSSRNVHYEPMVSDAAATLNEYATQNNVRLNWKSFADSELELAIQEFEEAISKHVAAILIGAETKVLSRSRREITLADNSTSSSAFGDSCAALFDSIFVINLSNGLPAPEPLYLNFSKPDFVCNNITSKLSVDFDQGSKIGDFMAKRLELVFENNGSLYWKLSDSSKLITDKGEYGVQYMGTPYGMETPFYYSFVCTRTYFQLYNATSDTRPLAKISLYIEKLQIQPWSMYRNETIYTFGSPNYCQGFFSNGIWMAITSSLLLTAILAFGVAFLFNIKTMDRFDDPKGKLLPIAAEK